MRIAFEAELFLNGNKTGIPWCADNLIRELAKDPDKELEANCFVRGCEKEMIAHIEEYKACGVRMNLVDRIKAWHFKLLWPFLPICYRWFFGKRADITLFFNFIVPRGVGGKTVAVVHDMAYLACPETVRKKTKNWLKLTMPGSCRRADAILTVSEFSKQELIKYLHVPAEKITVMPNGVDLEQFRPDIPEEEVARVREQYQLPKEYFLYLGTLEPRKNIERIIEAYGEYVKTADKPPALVLAGGKGWLYDSIFARVKELQLEEQVIFTGYVDAGSVAPMMKGARIFLFPSLYEGFGMPPLEAMACGTPVITSNTSSLPEVVGDAGILVDPLSTTEIREAMARLAEDDALCRELSERGLKRASQFTWKHSADCVRPVLEKLAGEII